MNYINMDNFWTLAVEFQKLCETLIWRRESEISE